LALASGLAAAPILHERFEPDADDDIRRGARTAGGQMPAAMDTSSGVVRAPDDAQSTRPSSVYGGDPASQGTSATYQIDRLTTQPDVVRYDDPFSPTVVPFKRLFAFDAVGEALDLRVADTKLRPLKVGGSVAAGEDAFYGDLTVDLVNGVPVRVPSVGPGAVLRALQSDSGAKLQVMRDGADNWFVVSDRTVRSRILMQLSVRRAVFGSPFADATWGTLAPHVKELPGSVHAAADRVLSHIGVEPGATPRAALERLVGYFRAFAPSEQLPTAASTEGLYEELAMSQKGVCRHRAYAFLITAQRRGLPTRLVHNEAHAWVEVFDGHLWHRLDLGGAAGRLDFQRPPDVPVHRPPSDDWAWPEDSSPGLGLSGAGATGRAPSSSSPGPGTPAPGAPDADVADPNAPGAGPGESGAPAQSTAAAPPSAAQPSTSGATDVPASEVTLELGGRDVRRGHPLRVFGRLTSEGRGCSFARVDLVLQGGDGRTLPLGSLATDETGRYEGEVIVPLEVPVGDEVIQAKSPGSGDCGPSQ
jgi:hypothetical protein